MPNQLLARNSETERASVRAVTINHAVELARVDGQAVTVRICQGDPYCPHIGEACVEAQLSGCRFCEVVLAKPDGTTLIDDPGKRTNTIGKPSPK